MDFKFREAPRPFIQPEDAKEREKRFNKPPYEVVSDAYDEFTENKINLIKAGALGIVGHDLDSAINQLISEAAAVKKSNDYANNIETFAFDNLRFRPFAHKGVEDYEKLEGEAKIKKDEELAVIDRDIKKEALLNLFRDLKLKGLLADEVQKEFENEFELEPDGEEMLEAA